MVNGSTAFAQAPTSSVGVFYIGPEDIVAEAINLSSPYIVRVDQPELAQVIVINNARISEEGLRFYGDQVRNERIGLVVFCGQLFPENLNDLSALLGISAFGMTEIHSPSTVVVEDDTDELPRSVTWSSAPEIHARTVISNPNVLLPLISTESGQPLIQRVRGREPAQTLVVGGWQDDPSNVSWWNWPYYNYLIYRLISDAAGRSWILNYADYPLSPVPQRNVRWGIAITGIAVIIGTATVYYLARRIRYLRGGHWQNRATQKSADQPDSKGWLSAGFHRPLAGLLILLPLNMFLYILMVKYQLYTLPVVLAPNPDQFSSWQSVERWAEVVWLLLDAGTGIAAVRYFASVRVRHPRYAFLYFQFYCWWQLIIGAVQLGSVALLSATIIPGAKFAHLSYFILVQSIIRFPGFLILFALLFRAMQRLDYEQYLNFLQIYGSIALQAMAYLMFTKWGATLPLVNREELNIVGFGAGLYAAKWLIFILGMFLYLRQGYKIEALSFPISNTQVSRQLLGFGIRASLGTLAIPLGLILQVRILDSSLSQYYPIWQNWIIIIQIASIFDLILQAFYRNMIPALSETITLNYKTLLRYYMTQGIRYGMWLSIFIIAVFTALNQPILDIVFSGAHALVVDLFVLVIVVGAFRSGTWLLDALLLASEHPGLSSALTILEQVLSIGTGLLLLPRWGTFGLLSAHAGAVLFRLLLSWILMQRLVIRVHIYAWQTVFSPLISGALVYYLLHVMLEWIPQTWQGIFVVVVLVIGLWIYAFLTAFWGGWDDFSLRELKRAVQLCGIGIPYAWGLYQSTRLGARISPLHGRFPIAIAGIAEEQAIAITYTRPASQ